MEGLVLVAVLVALVPAAALGVGGGYVGWRLLFGIFSQINNLNEDSVEAALPKPALPKPTATKRTTMFVRLTNVH